MHYVCSDIHGRWDRYAAMLKGLNLGREDRLYILGDAIDRGEDGIRILLDIKDRKNVTFFLGNHEMFLLEVMGSGEEGWRGTWLFNGGSKTAADFMALDKGQQEGLLSFLQESLAVMPDLEVGKEHYYLIHAFPCLNYLEEPVRVCQLSSDQEQDHLYDMVWTRADRAGSAEMKTLDHLAGLGRNFIFKVNLRGTVLTVRRFRYILNFPLCKKRTTEYFTR